MEEEEEERQNPIGQESEDDNCGKLNLKIGCSWFVRVISERRMGTCMHWNAKRWMFGSTTVLVLLWLWLALAPVTQVLAGSKYWRT